MLFYTKIDMLFYTKIDMLFYTYNFFKNEAMKSSREIKKQKRNFQS